ncbi:HK97 family phage prohead protease [Sphingorhabdus sp.]|jgi:HK97 family phage prohead protease|uniref:HK97 family phage prohead protease n=1 Tax=Sphingorhabdus sp. TaxID=1902408 RepID=UPI0037C56360
MRLAGYAAIFDAPDKGGDIVRKGAFARAAKAGLPLLWQHDQRRRIGFVESLSEDARGLRVIAQLDDDSAVVQAGSGLSFGYRVRAMQQQEYRELTDLDLIEVSIVATPMQPLARVLAVEASGPNITDITQSTQGE